MDQKIRILICPGDVDPGLEDHAVDWSGACLVEPLQVPGIEIVAVESSLEHSRDTAVLVEVLLDLGSVVTGVVLLRNVAITQTKTGNDLGCERLVNTPALP